MGLYPARYYGWGFIAVYAFASDHLSYVDPSFATDTGPVWKDNTAIVFTRHADGAADVRCLTRPAPPTETQEPDITRGSAASYLATPLAYQPIVSADGATGAYVTREGADRAIYLFGVGASSRFYIRYFGDDGQALSDIRLTPNGDLIAYVRGARVNKMGDVPNPQSEPRKPLRELWVGGTAPGQAPQLIGEGEAPMFTPDGQRLVFAGDKGLMIAPLFRGSAAGVRVGEASVFVPGRVSDAKFSPDGSKLRTVRPRRSSVRL